MPKQALGFLIFILNFLSIVYARSKRKLICQGSSKIEFSAVLTDSPQVSGPQGNRVLLFVILAVPPAGGFSHLVQIAKQVQVENFVSIRLVKAINECILIWLAGLNVLHRHPGFFGPVFLIQVQFAINAIDPFTVSALPTAEIRATFREAPGMMLFKQRTSSGFAWNHDSISCQKIE